jgi:hypothetical protein
MPIKPLAKTFKRNVPSKSKARIAHMRGKHPDRRTLPSRGRRKGAQKSVWDKSPMARGIGAGEEGRAAACAARLKSLEHGGGYWASPSCPSRWGRPRG